MDMKDYFGNAEEWEYDLFSQLHSERNSFSHKNEEEATLA
jgi:hypothetical protein